jgi:hypothetical protein
VQVQVQYKINKTFALNATSLYFTFVSRVEVENAFRIELFLRACHFNLHLQSKEIFQVFLVDDFIKVSKSFSGNKLK